jgi:hypothetical protein
MSADPHSINSQEIFDEVHSLNRQLWEVLVPTVRRKTGKPYHTRFHQIWDKKVEEISGGMTLNVPAKGRWIHKGERIEERMIPVRILCTPEEIDAIVNFTLVYYDQLAVMAYRISDKVILRHREEYGNYDPR